MKLSRVLSIFLVATLARGDLAPTTFTGTNVFPLQSADVRMATADVRIVWGDPCSLEAGFSLVNETDRDIEIEVGFPVGAYHPDSRGQRYEIEDDMQTKPLLEPVGSEVILITLNGRPVPAYRRLPHERLKEIQWHYASWYFAKIVFQPGPNAVTVRTRLTSSFGGTPYKDQLSYCISTGGRWKGRIGREVVEIVFPGVAVASLIDDPVDKSGLAEGERVRWEFNEFEPKGAEYDIDFKFYRPAVVAKLAGFRAAHELNPHDSKAALRYAVHLFCLGAVKGNSGFPPAEFSAEEFKDLLGRIEEPGDRAIFTRFYQPAPEGFASPSSEWTPDRIRMNQILADAGYCEDYPGISHVRQARALVEQCLARDPHDAEAWKLYLMHFWRFSFAARGHWFGQTVFSKPLQTAIRSAYKNCPKDPAIRAWYKAMKKDGEPPTVYPEQRYQVTPDAFRNEFYAK